jgi:hypothetical protein
MPIKEKNSGKGYRKEVYYTPAACREKEKYFSLWGTYMSFRLNGGRGRIGARGMSN